MSGMWLEYSMKETHYHRSLKEGLGQLEILDTVNMGILALNDCTNLHWP